MFSFHVFIRNACFRLHPKKANITDGVSQISLCDCITLLTCWTESLDLDELSPNEIRFNLIIVEYEYITKYSLASKQI